MKPRYEITRTNWTRYEKSAWDGSLIADWGSTQILWRIHKGWLGITRRVELAREEVPKHVLISVGCLGDTGGWVSALHPIKEMLEAL